MGILSYDSGSAASFDDVVNAMEAAADAAGWNTSIGDFGSGPDEGRLLELDWGNDYFVTVRSAVNLAGLTTPAGSLGMMLAGPGMYCNMRFDDGTESVPAGSELNRSNSIGPAPFRTVNTSIGETLAEGWVAPILPVNYHIYLYEDPDAMIVVVQTGPVRYQWMMFGEVHKFGTWDGGGFYGASGSTIGTSGGNFPSQPGYSLNGASFNRSYAPWHRVTQRFNQSEFPARTANTRLHIVSGTSETELDDVPWTNNAFQDPGTLVSSSFVVREAVANVHWSPLSGRSPNNFNQVSVLIPYWLQTQRASHRVLVARAPWIRHMRITNFNPGDTFELGGDTWQVFPYFEREGLTGLEGMAILRDDGSL